MFDPEAQKVILTNYVTANKDQLDKIVKSFFVEWNKIGKLSDDVAVSNRMQVNWLISMIKIILNTSGMPKSVQRGTLEQLMKNL